MTDSCSCLCQNCIGSWRDKPESPFPLISMKCLRHLVVLLRSCGCSGVAIIKDLGPVPSPQLSTWDLHFILSSHFARSGLGTNVCHMCTLRLHCLAECWDGASSQKWPGTLDHRRHFPGREEDLRMIRKPLPSSVLGGAQGLCVFCCCFSLSSSAWWFQV